MSLQWKSPRTAECLQRWNSNEDDKD
uniref:Uncharacterized protein n=1 Tax=Arundo donax TaxID=35708 RepID=A0A0A9BQS7_ARUDO